ncbi:CopL family metal-binding regulatory protein [Cognatiluteimonas lumbrici]|uniref:CopL family metal-binding regulatory protein n=1 Tax=Cognatiluteimonas lumbrici TaxID=2559601 RepID=UPI00112DE503|nr:CopL family metal-binding regulatory protein [Luteimonas lumbrici]
MLPRHALFRILLATLFLLNVAGAAVAGTLHTAGMHGAMAQQSSHATDCHEPGAGGMDHDGQPSAPAPDCCGDDCSTCTGFAHALQPPALPAAGAWAPADLRTAPDRGHASTALAQPVRPPIG